MRLGKTGWAGTLLALSGASALALALAPDPAAAAEPEAELHGDVKTFTVASFPYDAAFLPEDPFGVGVLDFRLKAEGRLGRTLTALVHHRMAVSAATYTGPGTGAEDDETFSFVDLGGRVGVVDEAVDLSWSAADSDGFALQGRIDRLYVTARVPHLDVTVGRQPITFGTTYFFQPLDLVAPFTPSTIDREYKPGVDAVRADAYFGVSGRVTAVAAYAGAWDLDGLVLATHGSMTFGVWDVGAFFASNRGDLVLGGDTAGSVGAVGVRGEATLTFPEQPDDDPFVRAVVGADRRWNRFGLSAELYLQTLGSDDPADYLQELQGPRFQRGEIWSLGRSYAALSADWEIDPLLVVNAFTVANLGDPSTLVGLGLSWSVGDNAAVDAGAYLGFGERPEGLTPRSEFGLYPASAYALLRTYF